MQLQIYLSTGKSTNRIIATQEERSWNSNCLMSVLRLQYKVDDYNLKTLYPKFLQFRQFIPLERNEICAHHILVE